jgi:hypothetical protein
MTCNFAEGWENDLVSTKGGKERDYLKQKGDVGGTTSVWLESLDGSALPAIERVLLSYAYV